MSAAMYCKECNAVHEPYQGCDESRVGLVKLRNAILSAAEIARQVDGPRPQPVEHAPWCAVNSACNCGVEED